MKCSISLFYHYLTMTVKKILGAQPLFYAHLFVLSSQGWFVVCKKYSASNFFWVYFSARNFEHGFTDWPLWNSAPLEDLSENGLLQKSDNQFRRRALCPSSSAHNVTPRIQSPGGSSLCPQGRAQLMRNGQLFRLIIQSLASVFRPKPLTLWRVKRQPLPTVQYPNRTCWMFHHSLVIFDLFKERSNRTEKKKEEPRFPG